MSCICLLFVRQENNGHFCRLFQLPRGIRGIGEFLAKKFLSEYLLPCVLSVDTYERNNMTVDETPMLVDAMPLDREQNGIINQEVSFPSLSFYEAHKR
jgi:hypothetical protein